MKARYWKVMGGGSLTKKIGKAPLSEISVSRTLTGKKRGAGQAKVKNKGPK